MHCYARTGLAEVVPEHVVARGRLRDLHEAHVLLQGDVLEGRGHADRLERHDGRVGEAALLLLCGDVM